MTTSTRLWELSEEIQQLEDAIAQVADNETLLTGRQPPESIYDKGYDRRS